MKVLAPKAKTESWNRISGISFHPSIHPLLCAMAVSASLALHPSCRGGFKSLKIGGPADSDNSHRMSSNSRGTWLNFHSGQFLKSRFSFAGWFSGFSIVHRQRAQRKQRFPVSNCGPIIPRRHILWAAPSKNCWDAVAPGCFPKDNTIVIT